MWNYEELGFKTHEEMEQTFEMMYKEFEKAGVVPEEFLHSSHELKAPDNINPNHYTFGGIECIDAIAAATSYLNGEDAFCTGNAIKYLWRWKQKNGIEDLRKAQWYINRLIQKESGIDE
jgi:hypothetical protein